MITIEPGGGRFAPEREKVVHPTRCRKDNEQSMWRNRKERDTHIRAVVGGRIHSPEKTKGNRVMGREVQWKFVPQEDGLLRSQSRM